MLWNQNILFDDMVSGCRYGSCRINPDTTPRLPLEVPHTLRPIRLYADGSENVLSRYSNDQDDYLKGDMQGAA